MYKVKNTPISLHFIFVTYHWLEVIFMYFMNCKYVLTFPRNEFQDILFIFQKNKCQIVHLQSCTYALSNGFYAAYPILPALIMV